jgi:hypothetical protein
MQVKFSDLKLEAIVTLDTDGAPTAWEFLVRRLILDEAGGEIAPAQFKRVPATREEIEAYLESSAFALKEDNAARHAQIAQLRAAIASPVVEDAAVKTA